MDSDSRDDVDAGGVSATQPHTAASESENAVEVPPKGGNRQSKKKRGNVGSRNVGTDARKARAIEMLATGKRVHEVAKALGVQPVTVGRWSESVRPVVAEKLTATIGGVADGAMRAHKLLSDNGERLAQVIADAACGELNDRNGMPVEDPQMVNARVNAAVRGLTFVVPQKSELDHKLPPADETLARIMAVLDARRTG